MFAITIPAAMLALASIVHANTTHGPDNPAPYTLTGAAHRIPAQGTKPTAEHHNNAAVAQQAITHLETGRHAIRDAGQSTPAIEDFITHLVQLLTVTPDAPALLATVKRVLTPQTGETL